MRYGFAEAVQSLRSGASFILTGESYKGLDWRDAQQPKPTEAELAAEIARLQAAWDYDDYKRKRVVAYPPATDYLDAMVKGDTTAMQQYVDACLAVKAKYPKPR